MIWFLSILVALMAFGIYKAANFDPSKDKGTTRMPPG